MTDSFLTCGNCARWGQPWKLARRMVLCEERKDKGRSFTVNSEACRYFIPKQTHLPDDLQTLRLFVQLLAPEQIKFLKFAAEQSTALLNVQDAAGQSLALGDEVSFEYEGKTLYGSVEGIDPDTGGVCVFCRAFGGGSAIVPSALLHKVSRGEAVERLRECVGKQDEIHIEMGEIINSISRLRRQRSLSEEEHQVLLRLEERFCQLKAWTTFQTALLTTTTRIK